MLHEFASHVRVNHHAIIDAWMRAVRADDGIPTARKLNEVELRDHLDAVLSRLAQQLLDAALTHDPEQPPPHAEAQAHGAARSHQCYRVDELAREVSVLRASFMEVFSAYLKERRQIEVETFLEISQIVHRFFDQICSDSVSSCVQEREAQSESATTTLRSLNETLEKTNRQYALADAYRRRTLRTVAHEMATPVNALGLGVTYLSESQEQAERDEARGLVMRTLEHLRTMLEQLVDFARAEGDLERLHVREFEVRPMYHYLVAGFEPIASAKGLNFDAELDPELKVLRSDENKIQRVAVNLLSNAIKYCPQGSVTLSLRAVDERQWSIAVADTGTGIPPEDYERVFAEFERLPGASNQPGLGLGLSIVRTLVDRLQGQITLESAVGKGSRFEVVLPREIEG